jgi:hypothetical protein
MQHKIDEYIDFTEKTIDYIKSTLSIFKNKTTEIPPDQINDILANYYGMSTWLTEQYEIETIHYKHEQQEYKVWWAEKIRAASNSLNTGRIQSKYANATETESEAINNNKDEYILKNDNLIIKERRVSLFKHLLESWKDILSVAITLASNSRADMKSLGIERIYNKAKNIKKPKEEID